MTVLPIVNDNCILRRNVSVQPYARCTVCTLPLRGCYAWQYSLMSFGLIICVLAVPLVPSGWATSALVVALLGLIVLQGVVNHRRTDELIFGKHQLAQAAEKLREQNEVIARAKDELERIVAARTAELREANQNLARANLELIDAGQRRETMVVDLSHELRTPITSIKGAAQNLLDGIAGAVPDPQREYIEIIRHHAERLIRAAESVIDAARGDERPIELVIREIDLVRMAQDVARGVLPLATERAIELEVAAPAAVRAQADEEKLRTVLENLLSNALKFTDRGGNVVVDVSPGRDGPRLTVRDTGLGIDPEDRLRIFERYYRSAHDRPGRGVGLAIARNLVRLHGGELSVSSRPGEGSEFVVTLPAVAA
jgi:signal transduction histidine kinase